MKNNVVILILALLIVVRVVLWNYGYSYDPWLYRFFPFELIWFLAGILSYRLYKFILPLSTSSYLSAVMLFFLLLFTLFFGYINPYHYYFINVIYLIYTAISIPFIFKLTKNYRIDRWIGELSYPMYISHFLLIKIASILIAKYHLSNSNLTLLTLALTLLFSYGMIELLGKPIERYRAKRLKNKVPGIKRDTYFEKV